MIPRSFAPDGIGSRVLLLGVLGGVLCGCNNVREFYKGNVALYGHSDALGRSRYWAIEIGTPQAPYDGQPPLGVQLPSGRIVSLRGVTPTVARGSAKDERAANTVDPAWRNGEQQILSSPYTWTFLQNSLVSLYLTGHSQTKARIGRDDGGPLYQLPLSYDEAIKLFGRPDRVYDHFAW